MQTVSVHQAKTHLSRLLEKVTAGEEIIICKADRPVAKLVALDTKNAVERKPGLLKSKIRIRKDFDAPLPSDILSACDEQAG